VSKRRRGRLQMLTARVTDGSATVSATWFNQPWLERQLHPGTPVRLRGRQGRYGFDVRSFDIGGVEATADFAPVYPASEEITAKKLRELVGAALPAAVVDPLPAALRAREGLPQRADALSALHRPRSLSEAEAGRRRLAFDELLLLQVAIARRRREREAEVAPQLPEPGELVRALPQGAPVPPHRASGALDRRDRRRPAADDADAAPAAGRRRLGEDRGRALCAAASRGSPTPGSADGADRDAGRAALSSRSRSLAARSASRARCSRVPRPSASAISPRRPTSSSVRTRSSRKASTSATSLSQSSTSSIDLEWSSGRR